MVEFQTSGRPASGHIALPGDGAGPGVLVLHAWWGLTPFFKELCDRLAQVGFVAFAPDLYGGPTAATIDEAKLLLERRDIAQMQATATGAVAFLRDHPAVRGGGLGAVGFSMGAAWALLLASLKPADIAAAVIFYGSEGADFGAARAAYQGHFAEDDEWEPLDGVRQVEADMRAAGREVAFHIYPDAKHWFFERDRPEYDQAAATLAWRRTVEFLREQLSAKVFDRELRSE